MNDSSELNILLNDAVQLSVKHCKNNNSVNDIDNDICTDRGNNIDIFDKLELKIKQEEILYYNECMDLFRNKFNEALEELKVKRDNEVGYKKNIWKIYYETFVNKMRRDSEKTCNEYTKKIEMNNKKLIFKKDNSKVYKI
jgi:hypothetical protein